MLKRNFQAIAGILSGLSKASEVICSTLGPNGRLVVIDNNDQYSKIRFTKDGATVAKHLEHLVTDPWEKIGVKIACDASQTMNEKVGDGSTTVVTLLNSCAEACYHLLQAGIDPNVIRGTLNLLLHTTETFLPKITHKITTEKEIEEIATIAANNDKIIGSNLAKLFNQQKGVVVIEESRTGESFIETKEGFYFEQGVASMDMLRDSEKSSRKIELTDSYVMVSKGKMETPLPYIHLFSAIIKGGHSLLIIAEDFSNEFLTAIVLNRIQANVNIVCVKAPGFGDRKTEFLRDVSIITGATIFDGTNIEKTKTMNPNLDELFGRAKKIQITSKYTTIREGNGSADNVKFLEKEIERSCTEAQSEYEKEKCQERLGRIRNGIGIYYVGAKTEIDLKETKDRVEDAKNAVEKAKEYGCVAGAGSDFAIVGEELKKQQHNLSATEKTCIVKIAASMQSVAIKIMENGGKNAISLMEKITHEFSKGNTLYGFDGASGEIKDIYAEGIKNSVILTKTAIGITVSLCKNFVLTDHIISKPDKTQKEDTTNMM